MRTHYIIMCDFNNLNQLQPCLIEDTTCIRSMQSYTIQKTQILQSTGKHVIAHADGFFIKKVVVSGVSHMKDITAYMINKFNQTDCPLTEIIIDSGKFNEYTEGDIECGTRTILQIDYMFNDKNTEEKTLKRKEIDDVYSTRSNQQQLCIDGVPQPDTGFVEVKSSAIYKINEGKCHITHD